MRDFLLQEMKQSEITIYSGGALGIDQFWMEVGHYLKIPVVALLPFPGFDRIWPRSSRQDLQNLLVDCSEVRYTIGTEQSDYYDIARALLQRNGDLVKACDIMVAYWNGTKGGTANAVRQAKDAKKQLIIQNPDLL
jgi:predicted Rossmann fold nucleotide-binding protein DprA/Smf involved in DNA uptake